MNIFIEHIGFASIIILCLSYFITNRIIPSIIGVVGYKRIMEHPNTRSSHQRATPSLGGIAFFASFMICMLFVHIYDSGDFSFNLMVSITIIFLMGLKDDLVVLSAKTKVFLQILAILIVLSNLQFNSLTFYSEFGNFEISFPWSWPLNLLIGVYIINAYNLIDGIDGLAGFLGITINVIFGTFFFIIELYYFGMISIVTIGFLLAFLRFNLSKEEKIFMGDTGSLLVGFLIFIQILRFLNLRTEELQLINIKPENLYIVLVSILFFPVIDVVRVILIRIMNKKNPFDPDRRHIHHVLIDKGLSHLYASLTLTASSLSIFLIIYLTNSFLSSIWLLLEFSFLTINCFYILILLDSNKSAKNRRKKWKKHLPFWLYKIEFLIRKKTIIILKTIFFKEMK